MRNKNSKGFTLIELMIVVAIIGILAAIAIPNFLRFQLKSKSSEGKVNVAAIRTAEESYFAEYGLYVDAVDSPTLSATPNLKQVFADLGPPGSNFATIGWSPEGDVFFTYAVVTAGANTAYTIDGAADIDADTFPQNWGYVHPNAQIPPVTAGGFHGCPAGGIYDPAGGPGLFNTVGPCTQGHGQSIF